MRNGNKYRIFKDYTTGDGDVIPAGTVCYYDNGYLCCCDCTGTDVRFPAGDVPEGTVFLHEESPFNREVRERRERIATVLLGQAINGLMIKGWNREIWEILVESGHSSISDMLVDASVKRADLLISRIDRDE